MSFKGPDPKPVTLGGIGRRKAPAGARLRGRRVATREEWAAIREAKLWEGCRLCGYPGATQAHHLVLRSQMGDDVADNIVPLCGICHSRLHSHGEYRRQLAESLTDAEYAYIVGKLGEGGPERLFGVGR